MKNKPSPPLANLITRQNIAAKIDEYGWFSFVALPPSSTALAVKKQAIIKINGSDFQLIKGLKYLSAHYKGKRKKEPFLNIKVRVVRVCECADSGGFHNMLVEWGEGADFITFEVLLTSSGSRIEIQGQSWNSIVISPGEPNSSPPPPIEGARGVVPSDVNVTNPTITGEALAFYERENAKPMKGYTTIAILDTGIKYFLPDTSATGDHHKYPKRLRSGSIVFPLSIVPKAGCVNYRALGYNSVTDYLDASSPHRDTIGLSSAEFGSIALYNPFDDHKVTETDTDGTTRVINARHGTTVAAIIHGAADNSTKIIPVKTFNNAGYGTLFDVLCAFRYVLNRKKVEPELRIINCSWVAHFGADTKPVEWLREVFLDLKKEQIFVVAAAGNRLRENSEGQRLGPKLMLYPACFSAEMNNVITVTTAIGDTPDTIQPFENYGREYVNVGIVTPDGSYLSPFVSGENIFGSSFGTAYVSGMLANYLINVPSGNRESFLESRAAYTGDEFQKYWFPTF